MDIERKVAEALKDVLINDEKSGVIIPMNFNINNHVKNNPKTYHISNNYSLVKKLNIWNEYGLVSDYCSDVIAMGTNISGYVAKLFAYIKKCIRFNSNVIRINKEAFSIMYNTNGEINNRSFINSIDYLCAKNIIQKTDKQSTYAVNPLDIFKGDISIFVDIYNRHFEDKEIMIIDDKIHIDKFVILRKTNDGRYIDTEIPKVKKA